MEQGYTPQMPTVVQNTSGTIIDEPTPAAETPRPETKKKSVVPAIIIAVLLFAGLITTIIIIISITGTNSQYKDFIKDVASKIESSDKQKVFYLYEDLKDIANKDIDRSSYANYHGGKDICLVSDGRMITMKGEDIQVKETDEKCSFKPEESAIRAYINQYYDGEAQEDKINGYYEVVTKDSVIFSKILIKDGEVVINDDSKYVGKLKTNNDYVEAISFFTESILNTKIGGDGSNIYNVKSNVSDKGVEFISILSSGNYGIAYEYAEKISKYLVNKKVEKKIIAISSYEIVGAEGDVQIIFRIYINIVDGKATISTAENNTNEPTR